MTFLAPLVLLGLIALAVPLLLHLLRSGDRKPRDFPALRYLRRTTREHARTIRLRQLLLLALRLSALALLVLAGARLVVPLAGPDHPPGGLVLVVDNGITAGTVVDEARVLDELSKLGLEIVEGTGRDDRVWVIPAGEPWRPALPRTPDEAAEILMDLEPTQVTPDLAGAVARGRAVLETAGLPLGQIVLLSNLPAESLGVGVGDGEEGVPVLVLSPGLRRPPNRGVGQVALGSGLAPLVGDAVDLHLQVVGARVDGVPFRFFLGGELAGAGRTGPDGSASLSVPSIPSGWVQGRVELEPDALRGDDVAYVAARVAAPPRVGVVGPVSPFLRDALQVLEAGGRIASSEPATADVVFSGGEWFPEPSEGAPSLVLLAPETPDRLPAVNRALAAMGTGWRLAPGPREPPLLGLESRDPALRLPGAPRAREAYRLDPGEGPLPRPILVLDNGAPWLVELEPPAGRVLLLTAPLSAEAGEMPTSAAMIPLVDFLASRATGLHRVQSLAAGDPLPLPGGAASVRGPEGTLRSVDGMSVFVETGRAGIYEILDPAGELLAWIPVNPVPPDTVADLDPVQAARRLGSGAVGARADDRWKPLVLEGRRGREIWRPLAAAALFLLLAEGWLAAPGPTRTSGPRPRKTEH